MKGLITKILIVTLLVVCFGGGIWQIIDHIEDRIIESTVNLIENSGFVSEIRTMVKDVATEVIHDLLSQGHVFSGIGGAAVTP